MGVYWVHYGTGTIIKVFSLMWWEKCGGGEVGYGGGVWIIGMGS